MWIGARNVDGKKFKKMTDWKLRFFIIIYPSFISEVSGSGCHFSGKQIEPHCLTPMLPRLLIVIMHLLIIAVYRIPWAIHGGWSLQGMEALTLLKGIYCWLPQCKSMLSLGIVQLFTLLLLEYIIYKHQCSFKSFSNCICTPILMFTWKYQVALGLSLSYNIWCT